jgi:hypothetical protein
LAGRPKIQVHRLGRFRPDRKLVQPAVTAAASATEAAAAVTAAASVAEASRPSLGVVTHPQGRSKMQVPGFPFTPSSNMGYSWHAGSQF